MQKKIVIGNWKMNPLSLKEAEKLLIEISESFSLIKKTEIIICPPFIYLESLRRLLKAKNYKLKLNLGAQDSFWENIGAYTGEVSAEMLYNIGVKYVILGHSERRAMGENNIDINKKIKSALSSGLIPIICIGENVRDEKHEYLNFVKMQIEESLDKISRNNISKIIIAYEPVWAIGKGTLPATVEEFREMSIFIRKILSDKFGIDNVENIRIIYGGSVDEKNAEGFIKDGHADGFLPGRASLDSKKFSKIIKICEVLNK
ncbi:triose-phosphate isomerase [Candidatus Nomurabacteria bacterium CG_4_10_14_0_2_um_filter_30_12]|uniref:Triosephosphate isomerase n=2 Tax=Candidatus Nomuraibacteriota TaxID=1752729 RepID=A0A1J4UYF7_9BACT|nr:MAG: triose-phosphate isomerase [Candidatus Nomurabacteria bacterium CG1_02_31_12]PIZ87698.1 MAG: triose-phosphate isomerase [Candidatus Nomurabacteria bacterium CG_4_10_14_0_2_um_filter_30_12]